MNNTVLNMDDSRFNGAVTKLNTPFDVYKLDCRDMISNAEAFKLREALLTMTFKKKSCDLYSFSQSPDFIRSTKLKKPKEVEQFLVLLETLKQNIATYLGKTFNDTISASCSKYDRGDYLLCHDDRVDDRSVAFIYYLNYDWLPEWGGTLDIYSVDDTNSATEIVENINPDFNTMIFFPVEKYTYHQVAENVSTFARISINGWFHCDELSWKMYNQAHKFHSPMFTPHSVSSCDDITKKCIESIFERPLFREAIKETFKKDGFIMCEGFFTQNMVDYLSNDIFSNDMNWKISGPLNKRHYKCIDLKDLPASVLSVVNLLKTERMFQFFKDCTGLEFLAVNIEVQRWHGGHYLVSGGNYGLGGFNVLSVYLFFSKCFGKMSDTNKDDLHYVFELKNTSTPKFACMPQHNTIFMVNRDSNMDSYVQYCKIVDGHAWTVVVANYVIKKDFDCKLAIHKVD
ncbi:prolyl 3-hydroxylase OGFOD1 isoform X2 [Myzus persicae]|uniref:prolyl 3-hydroxylase OGFOD1 isoform X2 n=1 Tax=Myzus persicae TaxID=13164 RepID=UPI000B937B97|nr:prolyl 3-hydroxylase OGFOD1 isoform X2 [Myzus persicae]